MQTLIPSAAWAVVLASVVSAAQAGEPSAEERARSAVSAAGGVLAPIVRADTGRSELRLTFGCRSRMESMDFAALAGLANLAELVCVSAPTDNQIAGIRGHPGLRRLVLNSQQLTDKGLDHLTALPALEDLSLRRAAYTAEGLRRMAERMGGLKILSFSQSGVTDDGLACLKSLPNLRRLSIYGCETTDRGLENFKGLTRLEYLFLGNLKITDDGAAILRGLTGLTEVRISGTQMHDAALEHIRGLPALRTVTFYNTRITAAGAGMLRASMPAAKVSLDGRLR